VSMIDFRQFREIIPEKGSLTLVMTKQNNDVLVTIAPKFKEKTEEQSLAPLPLKGTPEELNDFFGVDIKTLSDLQQKVANLPKPSVTVKARINEKKQELTKKLTSPPKPENKAEPKATTLEKKEDSPLFDTNTEKKEQKSEAQKETLNEAPGEPTEEELF